MASTFDKIATANASGTGASITFSSISGSYTDLVLLCNVKISVARNLLLRFNSDTGSNYSRTLLTSDPGSSRQQDYSYITFTGNGVATTNIHSSHIIHIMNYSNATTYKTVIVRSDNADSGVDAVMGTWRSTSAITSLEVYTTTANFDSTSIFTLYGIKAA